MEAKKLGRGSNLSIFVSDRMEDIGALIFAQAIAFGVLILIGQ
jgi:hypothetical protein